ncbi:radical SAM/SPASM domain-containing protein [Rectinema subterraneum]|nr:radical SAM protein [Rectinema subterraneum]
MYRQMKKAFFLIKPVSGNCNLACHYCFYRDLLEHQIIHNFGFMDSSTVDILIERAFELDADILTFVFQGGEPTLAGLPYFEHFVKKTQTCTKSNLRHQHPQINFSIQTNAIALNTEWARFFKRESFLVGISIDGARIIHDTYRTHYDGSGTWAEVMHGIELLRKEGVLLNALCVVTDFAADNAELIYNRLRNLGFEWIQFIPWLPPLKEESVLSSELLTPGAYAHFLKAIFDLYYQDWLHGSVVHVQWFDNLVAIAAGMPPESCGMLGCCPVNFTVEANGSVFPCDFYVSDEWCLGNIHDLSFQSMKEGIIAHHFIERSSYIDPSCRICFAFFLCRGGCRRYREPFFDGKLKINRYCTAFKEFFQYAGEHIMNMAAFYRN